MKLLFAILAASLAAAAPYADEGLRDDPIAVSKVTYLDGNDWKAESPKQSISIPAAVPGDVLTDLENAGLIGDPLYEQNWLNNSALWQGPNWVYSKEFSVSEDTFASVEASTSSLLLVFDGIKMGAVISVNGIALETATDQFLRYIVPLNSSTIVSGTNNVSVEFDANIDVNGRFMACTGGWDWAPYTDTTLQGSNTFSRGIWKSVYLAEVDEVALTAVVPLAFYQGEYTTTPMSDGSHGGFLVSVRAHFWSASGSSGTYKVTSEWGESGSKDVQLPAGFSNATVNITASAQQIKLWWPNGLGAQPLYTVTASFATSGSTVSSSRDMGFRFAVLVTGNDTDPAWVAANKDADGSADQGMFFRVNGAAVFARGGNMIPLEELEGRLNSTAYAQTVQSAVDANFNMLRIWGGGIFAPKIFYDTCDKLGIMLYHDLQYAQGGHSPTQSDTQAAEFRHQMQRLASHPSVTIIDGCNECHVSPSGSTAVYLWALGVVVEQDSSRIIWPSCPSNGWKAGVNRLTGMPNGSPLGLLPNAKPPTTDSSHTIETHGPYQHGGSAHFPAVNGDESLSPFTPNVPIQITPATVGLDQLNVFASEFGGVVMSSFESMAPTLSSNHWSVHGGEAPDTCKSGGFARTCTGKNPMAQRNYPVDNFISVYFGNYDLNTTGTQAFQKQLYHSMIGQAIEISANIMTRRSGNQFGTLVWQYGEIWPTGGWGSIEYASPRPGQVVGGRWKPLQYWYKRFVYADVVATCGAGNTCYIRNDAPFPFNGTLTISSVYLSNSSVAPIFAKHYSLPAGPGAMEFFQIGHNVDAANEVLQAIVTDDASGNVVSANDILYTVPGSLAVQKSNAKVAVADTVNADGTVDVTISVDAVSVFATLTTAANGRFSDNAFLVTPPSATVQFVPFGPLDINTLKSTIRVEDVSTYQ